MSEYVWEDGPLFVKHLDGVKWYEAPVPPRRHKCWAQTKGMLPSGEEVERCACGAVKNPKYRSWLEVNSRKTQDDDGIYRSIPSGVKDSWWRRWLR
jgi:hypothetical protein